MGGASPDILDIALPPSPPQLAADVRAAGARCAGIYLEDFSYPAATRDAAYFQAALATGIEVLPIVTPGMTPTGDWSVYLSALSAGGFVGHRPDSWVAIDLEQPGMDTPPRTWVAGFCAAMHGAGYRVLTYCQSSLWSTYANLAEDAWWLAWWTFVVQPPPPGWAAQQFSDQWVGAASGYRYDASTAPGMSFFQGADMTSQELIATLDSLAVQVSGVPSFVGWMQGVLGTEQKNYNQLASLQSALGADVAQIKTAIAGVSTSPLDPAAEAAVLAAAAAVARIETALKGA